MKQSASKKIKIPGGKPAGRLSCPECGNDNTFVEVATDVVITTYYQQNDDGSFTPEENETDVLGEISLICGKCNADLTRYHLHFQEMLF